MAMDIEDYATSFRPDIIDAVSGWCQGATFAKVLTLTDVFEVRVLLVGLDQYWEPFGVGCASHSDLGNCTCVTPFKLQTTSIQTTQQ